MAKAKKSDKNANYDFYVQNEPKSRMGSGSFANMPDKPISLRFGQNASYRDGIINSFAQNVEEVSGIHENCGEY